MLYVAEPPRTLDGGEIRALDVAGDVSEQVLDTRARDAVAVGSAVYYAPSCCAPVRVFTATRADTVAVTPPAGLRAVGLAASPSGERIALTAHQSDTAETRLCWFDTAAPQAACAQDAVADGRPAFGTDGGAVYYNGSDGIRRHDVVTRSDELVLAHVHAPGGIAVADGGRALVVSTCTSTTHVAIASTPPVQIGDDPGDYPTVASDGTLAFAGLRDNHTVVLLRDGNNHVVHQLTDAARDLFEPALSPDGAHVAFAQVAPTPGIHVVATAAPTFPDELTHDRRDSKPMWLDASQVVFEHKDDSGVPSLYVVSIDTHAVRLLAPARRLLAAASGRAAVADAHRGFWLDARTGVERPMTEGPDGPHDVTLSPSGQWAAFMEGNARQVITKIDLRDPGATLQAVITLPSSVTGGHIAIDDRGSVYMTPTQWAGDLLVVPAMPGTRF